MSYNKYRNSRGRKQGSYPARKPQTGYQNPAESAYESGKSYQNPEKPAVKDDSLTLQAKAFRDLSNIHTIDVKMDPNTEMSYGAYPYAIIGRTNQVIDANYPGRPNIAGNSITLLQNNTTNNQLMSVFDGLVLSKKINYLYLPMREGSAKNLAMTSEVIKSIEQAIAFGHATMLTQLPFTTSAYESDIPIPTQFKDPMGRPNRSAQYYAACMHYQCTLQSLVQPIASYIELRSLEQEITRMGFRVESPLYTEFFGLMKKASFVASINMIGTVAINEYFDVNWYKQMNTITCVPSRKTMGMTDPLTTIVATHIIPSLKIKVGDVLTYDSTKLTTGAAHWCDADTGVISNTPTDLETLITNICKMLNPVYVIKFIRRVANGRPLGSLTTVSSYVEAIKQMVEILARIAATFSTAMSDIRTFFDKLSQSNLIYWQRGVSFFISNKIEQLVPKYNVLAAHVIQTSMSGSKYVQYDSITKRWRTWTLWNKYEGIPEYDRLSGGSFLTLSLREPEDQDSNGDAINWNTSEGLIPVLFDARPESANGFVVNRRGETFSLATRDMSSNDILTNGTLARLDPIYSNMSIKVVTVDLTNVPDTEGSNQVARLASALKQCLTSTFGYCCVKRGTNYSYDVDSDLVCFLDFELEDVSNDVILYARNYSPFRTSTPDGSRTIGFSAL